MSNFTETQIVQAVAKAAYAGKLKSVTMSLHELHSIVNYLPQPNKDYERAWHRVRRHPALMQRDNVARTHEQNVERVMDRLDELEALEGVADQQQRWQDWYDQHRIVQQEQQRQEQLRSQRIQYKHAPKDKHPKQQLVHAIRQHLPDAWNNAEPQPYEQDLVSMSWEGLSEYTKVHVTNIVHQVIDRVITRS